MVENDKCVDCDGEGGKFLGFNQEKWEECKTCKGTGKVPVQSILKVDIQFDKELRDCYYCNAEGYIFNPIAGVKDICVICQGDGRIDIKQPILKDWKDYKQKYEESQKELLKLREGD